MADDFTRPGPYVPLSRSFATGRTGTAIIEEFGVEGLGVWVAMLAAAGVGNKGQIVFMHEHDWGAIGLETGVALHPPKFELKDFLRFLGRRKQTRTTRQGRVMYVTITQWERWNHIKKTEQARQRMSRIRHKSERNEKRTTSEQKENSREVSAYPEADTETEVEQVQKPKAVRELQTSREPEPEWAAEDEERPQDFHVPENLLREMA